MNSDPSLVSFEESFRDSSNRIDKTLKLMNENLGIKEHDKVMLYDFEDGVSSSLWSDIESNDSNEVFFALEDRTQVVEQLLHRFESLLAGAKSKISSMLQEMESQYAEEEKELQNMSKRINNIVPGESEGSTDSTNKLKENSVRFKEPIISQKIEFEPDPVPLTKEDLVTRVKQEKEYILEKSPRVSIPVYKRVEPQPNVNQASKLFASPTIAAAVKRDTKSQILTKVVNKKASEPRFDTFSPYHPSNQEQRYAPIKAKSHPKLQNLDEESPYMIKAKLEYLNKRERELPKKPFKEHFQEKASWPDIRTFLQQSQNYAPHKQ